MSFILSDEKYPNCAKVWRDLCELNEAMHAGHVRIVCLFFLLFLFFLLLLLFYLFVNLCIIVLYRDCIAQFHYHLEFFFICKTSEQGYLCASFL